MRDLPQAPDSDPARLVAAIEETARTYRTPSGEEEMVWRMWGDGAPLLLLHGGSGSWTHWFRNIPTLARAYQLWVPDLPGLGDSAMPPRPWTPASVAATVTDGLCKLVAPDAPLSIAGFSFGGHVAGHVAGLAAARLAPGVRALVLIGVAALGVKADPRPPFLKARAGMAEDEIAGVFRQNLEVLMFADPGNIDALAVHLQRENVRRARFRSRPFAATDGLARALERVSAPLKTIWGTRDIVAKPSLELRIALLRRHHPELEVRLIEGAGHWVAYEAAERFNAALLELLA
jgi:pimeloyl-ACP methyl ester carboxylesterase